ncbi:helix-turn-helix domain-containing protein [Streptobacillus moniliformis]|uniref:helix-turn-helix domain-containing protein n=1 Tax=Streptobacillus moniliformis TaxID=34105 RepID=UPI0007E394A8|nr:helix-turn-helix transcriptional regulator [Streptobacillus moniliformis]
MSKFFYIKVKRKELEISQKKFATILKITPKYLSDIENGRKKPSKELEKKIKNTIHYYEHNRKKEYQINETEKIALILRENNFYNTIAQINRELIEINKLLEERSIKISTLINYNDENIIKKIKRPLITTIKHLEYKKKFFEEILTDFIIKIEE